jgi:hypothetical protein
MRGSKRRDAPADDLEELLARHRQIRGGGDGFAKVNFDFAQTADRMKSPDFRGDKLHVLEEHRDNRHTRLVGDVVQPWLAGADLHAVAARALGKNHQVKLPAGAAKRLQLKNPGVIKLPTFQQKADGAAQQAFDSRGMPDGFVAEYQDRIAPGPPAERAKQEGVEQADVIANEEITVARVQFLHTAGAPQIRQREKKMRPQAKQCLDKYEPTGSLDCLATFQRA